MVVKLRLAETGVLVFKPEHVVLHEFAHAIVETIMTELGGNFNGVNFNNMTETQRSDWSIQFTNTLLDSMNKSLETGKGQHKRDPEELPSEKPTPLND